MIIRVICQYCKKHTDCGVDKIVDYKTPQPYYCINEECKAYLLEIFEDENISKDEDLT